MPIQRGARVEQDLPPDYNGFVSILEGGGAIGTSATEARTGDVAWLTLSAARGPFVMNTGLGSLRSDRKWQIAGAKPSLLKAEQASQGGQKRRVGVRLNAVTYAYISVSGLLTIP